MSLLCTVIGHRWMLVWRWDFPTHSVGMDQCDRCGVKTTRAGIRRPNLSALAMLAREEGLTGVHSEGR